MSKEKVELYLEDDDYRTLYVRKKDGTEYAVTVFEGGGYYTAIWLRTKAEIEESAKERKKNEEKWEAEREERTHKKKVDGLARLIMFMQRRKS